MLVLLAIPVIVAVASVHRLIQAVAPSNLLVRSVLSARPRWRIAAALLGLAAALLTAMHVVADAVVAGAPGWLNLVVLVLAWDAIKLGLATALVTIRILSGKFLAIAGRSQEPRVIALSRRQLPQGGLG